MKGGAVDFLTKPLDEDALMRAVDAALGRGDVLREEVENAATLPDRYRQGRLENSQVSDFPDSRIQADFTRRQ
ncbi:hypothetical protein [Paraburkholderia phytofirmans]|jgi:FixJ family two-component response regulator|uniref:Response regulatory domain-containing protein n=1 Tax=Paraburkholderia phytofirmans OLGA172 TaxID=1417228 RepID=A0A160FMD3_9BURK|nr:hypothetical protein [Paraburkholderia phytofirmans]ANB73681.1 hypothetical protein AYM40_15940 [Paraburkholderia phytofirmans OLGA172]